MLQEAIFSADSPAFPAGMLQDRINLLYKGKGAGRALPCRPITLLNTDYKFSTDAVASRVGLLLTGIVDAT